MKKQLFRSFFSEVAVIREYHRSADATFQAAEEDIQQVIRKYAFTERNVCRYCHSSIPTQNFRCCPDKLVCVFPEAKIGVFDSSPLLANRQRFHAVTECDLLAQLEASLS